MIFSVIDKHIFQNIDQSIKVLEPKLPYPRLHRTPTSFLQQKKPHALVKIIKIVIIAKDIIAKIKLVNSEMKILVDWDEEQIMRDAKQSLSRYAQVSGKLLKF